MRKNPKTLEHLHELSARVPPQEKGVATLSFFELTKDFLVRQA
jgi:hypothetical protein